MVDLYNSNVALKVDCKVAENELCSVRITVVHVYGIFMNFSMFQVLLNNIFIFTTHHYENFTKVPVDPELSDLNLNDNIPISDDFIYDFSLLIFQVNGINEKVSGSKDDDISYNMYNHLGGY